MDIREEFDELMQSLATERDELRVKAHLLSREVADEWDDVEKKWDTFQLRASKVADASKESATEIYEASKLLGNEIGEAYRRIRKSL